MLIVLNGPLGVGKTETSWALLERLEQAAMLDGDYVAAMRPLDWHDEDQLRHIWGGFRALLKHHQEYGIPNFVANWVFETPEALAGLRDTLAEHVDPIRCFRLHCDWADHEQRIRGRLRPGWELEWELERAQELNRILEAAAERGDVGEPLDTTGLSLEETADLVFQKAMA